MSHLELSAHMTVRAGCLEGFKKQAAELIRITKEQDTRTLRYDWFLSSDGTECEVREAYTGPEGLIEHNTHIFEDRDKLFMPYYSTKRRGSGLGLAIVRRIIAEHGGSIEAADNSPTGTVFTVELPI